MKFNKGKVLHHEQHNLTQQYRLEGKWLTAGDQLIYRIVQARSLFLQVQWKDKRQQAQHETWESLTQYMEKNFYCESGQTLELVSKAVVESPPWRHARLIWTQF